MKQEERRTLENTVVQLLNVLREQSHGKYVAGCERYKRQVEAACEAEREYLDLDLAEGQREVIEHLLQSRSDAEDCELTLTYVAGLLDSLMFLRSAGFLDLYVEDEEKESA